MSTYTELNKEVLFKACRDGNTETFISLISECPDIERKSLVNIQNNYGNTPLSLAIRIGAKEIVKALLEMPEIDISTQNKYGKERAQAEDSRLNEDVEVETSGDSVE